jgi:hypothetical protein
VETCSFGMMRTQRLARFHHLSPAVEPTIQFRLLAPTPRHPPVGAPPIRRRSNVVGIFPDTTRMRTKTARQRRLADSWDHMVHVANASTAAPECRKIHSNTTTRTDPRLGTGVGHLIDGNPLPLPGTPIEDHLHDPVATQIGHTRDLEGCRVTGAVGS